MASLTETVESMAARLERQSALLVQAFETMQVLQRNIQRMEGEPMVTTKVPRTAAATLEQLPTPTQYAQPRPGAQFAMGAKPTHVSQRKPDGTPANTLVAENDDPATLAAKRKQALARAASMNTGAVGG
jgi:hypothetical protein